jgi:hypothetical protein
MELQLFASSGSFEAVQAAAEPVFVIGRADVDRVHIVEMPAQPEEPGYYTLMLQTNPSARARLSSFVAQYSLYAMGVTIDGVRGSLTMVVWDPSYLVGGFFGTREEIEDVAEAFGAPTKLTPFDPEAHRRASERWSEHGLEKQPVSRDRAIALALEYGSQRGEPTEGQEVLAEEFPSHWRISVFPADRSVFGGGFLVRIEKSTGQVLEFQQYQ